MALIGQIRNNSWLLIVFIGLGLGGFIIMDMFSGQTSIFGSDQLVVGEFNGEKLDWNQFSRTEQLLYGNSGGDVYSRRNALWNYFVEETLVKEEAEALGLGVSKDELMDLQFGDNARLSPIITARFSDPSTRQVSREQLDNFKTQIENNEMDPNVRSYWAHQEKEVINERLKTKINALVSKALYTPNWMAEMIHKEQGQKADLAIVKIPFDEVDNGDVAVEDADYSTYLSKNQEQYRQKEETRKLEFVVFTVEATEEDKTALRKELTDLQTEFNQKTAEDVDLFTTNNFGSYDPAYVKKSTLFAGIADTVMGLPIGSTYGPYEDGQNYKMVKVLDRKIIPDSVQSRHILLRIDNPVQLTQVQKTADSIKTVLESGQASFDSLALRFGTDGTRTEGGDLGFASPGRMVKEFNDLIFYNAEPNKIYTVQTQFGVHVVEVTNRKYINNDQGVQVAYLSRTIEPSEDTRNNEYGEALEFVGQNRTIEDLRKSVEGMDGVSVETSPSLKKNDFVLGSLGTGNSSREAIRWAFETAGLDEVSADIYTYDNPTRYVIVALKSIQEAGIPAVANIKDEIEQSVINVKKAEVIKGKISGQDLGAIAANFKTEVDTTKSLNFSASFIPNLGAEPKVLAKAFQLDANQVSEPIVGENGVYVVKVLNKIPPPAAPANLQQIKASAASSISQILTTGLYQALKDKADIEDNRSRFY